MRVLGGAKRGITVSKMLQTERLRLRLWQEDDLEPFARMNADPRVMEFFPATLSRQQSEAMLQRNAPAQAAECGRTAAERSAGADQIADASSLETRRERRDGETGETGQVAGEGTPGCGRQPEGRDGGMLHDQSDGHTTFATSLPCQHEPD